MRLLFELCPQGKGDNARQAPGGTPSRAAVQAMTASAPKRKRKNATASHPRARKKARVAARASSARAEPEAMPDVQEAKLAAPGADVTKEVAPEVVKLVAELVDLVAAVPDATNLPPSVTERNPPTVQVPHGDKPVKGAWVCLICTFTNPAAETRCANFKLEQARDVIDSVASDHEGEETSTVADETSTVTDDKSTAPDKKSTAPDLLYYPISGEYYTGRDIHVGGKIVTTVETWQVAYINDRHDTPMGVEYQVLWAHPDRACKNLYVRSWEPRAKLKEDDFEEEMDLVDCWKASSVELFETFWREDEVGVGLLGADDDNLGVFNALERASELLGRPEIVTQQDIDQFVEDRFVLYRDDLREGATWKDISDFLIRLRNAGRAFNYNAFVKNNYSIPGRRGARVLGEIEVDDGVYIVGAYNHRHIGHGAVLTVQGKKRLIYDGKAIGKPISSAKGWINFYAFFRPFIVF